MVPITKKVKTGWFSSENVVQGHKYYLGVQLVWSWGAIDEFISLLAEDKPLNIVDFNDYSDPNQYTFWIDSPTHMSADEPANGVTGMVRLYRGTTTQPVNAYLQSEWGRMNHRRSCACATPCSSNATSATARRRRNSAWSRAARRTNSA